MNPLSSRGVSLSVALAAVALGLLAPPPGAVAATTVQAAAAAFGLGSYTVQELPASGDITDRLTSLAKVPAAAGSATVLHVPAGQVTVHQLVRPANGVYVVAEPGTTVTWRGSDAYLLRFESVTGGVYGGTWDGSSHRGSTTLVGATGATVQLVAATFTAAGRYGVSAYQSSRLTLHNVVVSNSDSDGVHVQEYSTLTATGLTSTRNQRNGVQLSAHSSGTISNSTLDRNGQAVKGSTTGKTGHGLGVASSRATVSATSMSGNKVCGVSLSGSADAAISGSHLDRNGRHGLGTVAGTTATISDSTADKNGYNGVLASGSGTHVSLQRVTITSAKKIGLSVPSKGNASLAGSVISKSGTQNVSVSARGSLTMLDGNTITSAKKHGVAVSEKSTITVSGAGNLIAGNRKDGLLLMGSGTRGTITAAVSFHDNHAYNGLVLSKAKLTTVTCSFSGRGGKKISTHSGGKVTLLH